MSRKENGNVGGTQVELKERKPEPHEASYWVEVEYVLKKSAQDKDTEGRTEGIRQ